MGAAVTVHDTVDMFSDRNDGAVAHAEISADTEVVGIVAEEEFGAVTKEELGAAAEEEVGRGADIRGAASADSGDDGADGRIGAAIDANADEGVKGELGNGGKEN